MKLSHIGFINSDTRVTGARAKNVHCESKLIGCSLKLVSPKGSVKIKEGIAKTLVKNFENI